MKGFLQEQFLKSFGIDYLIFPFLEHLVDISRVVLNSYSVQGLRKVLKVKKIVSISIEELECQLGLQFKLIVFVCTY